MRRIIFLTVLVCFVFACVSSAQNDNTKQQNIFESLSTPDSITKTKVTIHQDKRLEMVMLGKTNNGFHDTSNGFRVQVFSSNTQKTAKSDAFRIEKQIESEFPNQPVYVNYTSPFWKVSVGDFRTMEQAKAIRQQLIETFPNLRSETYIVKDQINITGSN